jgi:hypothetical protein
MPCQDCSRLTLEMNILERRHRFAHDCLDQVQETAEPELYQKLRIRLSDARMEHELARLILEKHQQDGHAGE